MTKQEIFEKLCQKLNSDKLFFGHGVVDEQDEAMMVLMSVLNQSPAEILGSGSQLLNKELVDKCLRIVKQRLDTQKPMAYILGVAYFAGLEFAIDESALVPRSPIAEIILNNFDGLLEVNKVNSALDLCTGSGCIGLALAYYHDCNVTLSDISSQALSLAEKNRQNLNLIENVSIIQSDLFEKITGTFDLIVSNPPYVSQSEYESLPHEYKVEPKIGLVTPLDGLAIPLKILVDSIDFLSPNGHLIVEVGYSDELLEDTFSDVQFNWLNFANGGQGVFVFNKHQLIKYRSQFVDYLENNLEKNNVF